MKKIKYVCDIIVASWDKNISDFETIIITEDININENETALDAAIRKVKNEKINMFRHIAVFDEQNKETDLYTISNVILAITDNINQTNFNTNQKYLLNQLDKDDIHYEILNKTKTIIDYDIYSQIFDTQKFSSDFITSILGEYFTTSELIKLAKWSNRQENKTTFYRNIDNNYDFMKKEGRNKYYQKKTKDNI